MYGSVRHQVTINRSADEVWAVVGAVDRLHDWFPGITACEVEGDRRTIHTATGLSMPEEILVCDPITRRFQYRLDLPIISYHRGTIDVLVVDEATSLVTYATDADPRTMALTIGGGTLGALRELRRQLDPDHSGEDG